MVLLLARPNNRYQDDPGLVELLLLRGGTAMSMMKDNDGMTPLEVAQRHNPGKFVLSLLHIIGLSLLLD
jgi:hypothetical protein